MFDVTGLVRPGANAIGAWLAEGWYGGTLGWDGGRRIYGHRLALLAQLEIALANGTTQMVATAADDHWRAHASPIVASGIYAGEAYDGRLEQPGWSGAGFDDREWLPTTVVERDLGTLVARNGPPVRRTETLRPVAVTTSPSGRTPPADLEVVTMTEYEEGLPVLVAFPLNDVGRGAPIRRPSASSSSYLSSMM